MSVLHVAQTEANGSPREYFWWLCNETRFRIGIHDGYPSPLCFPVSIHTWKRSSFPNQSQCLSTLMTQRFTGYYHFTQIISHTAGIIAMVASGNWIVSSA